MKEGYPPEVEERLRADSREIVARYPVARSALMPMLHLVQSVDGYVSPDGIDLIPDADWATIRLAERMARAMDGAARAEHADAAGGEAR